MENRILDIHAHIFPGKIAHKAVDAIGAFYDLTMDADGSPETLLREGVVAGITRYAVHSVATNPGQVQSINRFIREETALHPEFIGFATLHPYMEHLEEEVDTAIAAGMQGIKIHPDFQRFQLDEPKALAMFRCIAGRLPVLVHTGDARYDYSTPLRMARAMDAVPNLTVIGAHFGGYNQWEDSRRYLLGRNLYIDTSSALFALTPAEAVDMIHLHGTEKTLFGTDFPMWTPVDELQRFNKLPLTARERHAIFWENGARLLGLE